MNAVPFIELKSMAVPSFCDFQLNCSLLMSTIFGCCCSWMTAAEGLGDGGLLFSDEEVAVSSRLTVVISWMLDLLLSFPPVSCLLKYFWAWLATWVGVLVVTKLREIFLQSPLPNFLRPIRNCLQGNKLKKKKKNTWWIAAVLWNHQELDNHKRKRHPHMAFYKPLKPSWTMKTYQTQIHWQDESKILSNQNSCHKQRIIQNRLTAASFLHKTY